MKRFAFKKNQLIVLSVLVVFGLIGSALLLHSHAATGTASAEPENGAITSPASSVADTTASGGKTLKFGAAIVTVPPPPTGACQGTANTPGGSDGVGGCFPGDYNTGYPHRLKGDTRTPVTLTPYTGACEIRTSGTVIDSKTVNCGLIIYTNNVTIKNSKVKGIIYENATNASVTVMDSEVDGGAQYTYPTIGGGSNVTAIRVNAHGGEHTVQCYGNCDVENSWLHDQFEAGSGPHQNGFLSNDGQNYTLTHNSVFCSTTGCTSDIAFTDDGLITNATIDRNLFIAAPGASYCLDASSVPSKNNPMYLIKVTNNVFQHGKNGKCAVYGPSYGWDAATTTPGKTGYGNVWTNNRWDDGSVLNP